MYFHAIDVSLCESSDRLFDGKLLFKLTKEAAVLDALRRHTPNAKDAPYRETLWCVVHFMLSEQAACKLFLNHRIQWSVDGDGVEITGFTLSAEQAHFVECIGWPAMGESDWLVNLGFPVSSPSSTPGNCTVCDRSDSILYLFLSGLMCHRCLLHIEMLQPPMY